MTFLLPPGIKGLKSLQKFCLKTTFHLGFLEGNHMGNSLISSQYALFITSERIFWALQGYKMEHWEEVSQKTTVEFRLFPLSLQSINT